MNQQKTETTTTNQKSPKTHKQISMGVLYFLKYLSYMLFVLKHHPCVKLLHWPDSFYNEHQQHHIPEKPQCSVATKNNRSGVFYLTPLYVYMYIYIFIRSRSRRLVWKTTPRHEHLLPAGDSVSQMCLWLVMEGKQEWETRPAALFMRVAPEQVSRLEVRLDFTWIHKPSHLQEHNPQGGDGTSCSSRGERSSPSKSVICASDKSIDVTSILPRPPTVCGTRKAKRHRRTRWTE